MVRYILHSFLILVMAQLANITGGVIMTELQRGQIQHEISSLATIDLTQKFQIPVLQDIPVTPTETVRLPERELMARVRRLSEGMLFPWEIAAENNLPGKNMETCSTPCQSQDRYFHELCRLII